jgi:phage shock protein PspC (stress-responsive transcriptional regulator)
VGGFEASILHEAGAVMPNAKLKRSNDRMIAGVCGGIAEWVGWSADKVRVVYVIVSILSAAFPGIIVYLVLWLVMPEADE